MNGTTAEDAWVQTGLSILSIDADKTLVLFSTDAELTEFRRKVAEYRQGPRGGAVNPAYAGLVAVIDSIGPIEPNDRIGMLLRAIGLDSPAAFNDRQNYSLDVEIWDLGTRALRERKVLQIREFVESTGGQVTDQYLGYSLTLLRITASGRTIKQLLDLPEIAIIDLPPAPDDVVADMVDVDVGDFPAVAPPPEDAPSVTIFDTGIATQHPLLAPAIGEVVAFPDTIPPEDQHGHGTRVGGIALYENIQDCIEGREFRPNLRLHSAKLVNDRGTFDDQLLVTSLFRQAFEHLRQAVDCRVFNISLGDRRLVYDGQKAGVWAAAIDELIRELDIVVVISAGNFHYVPPAGEPADRHVQNYPRYLFDPTNRIVAPAEAALALTVGSICNAANVRAGAGFGVEQRPIGQVGQPSPFSRGGPGVNGSIKPDLCDFGGNLLFDGALPGISVRHDHTGVITTNHQYLDRLFTTSVGTSLAAPRVAHKAAALLSAFPNASANLVRALLAASAQVTAEANDLLRPFGEHAAIQICGYGVPNLIRARSSDDNRVVLYAEGTINLDQFFVYEVPIVPEFSRTSGRRSIAITLAFDPPVRHTRADYLGVTMSFRLIRGASLEAVTEHFRRRAEVEGPVPEMPASQNCSLEPGPQRRDKGTLQRARFEMTRNPRATYGDTYYLVVRCEKKWAEQETDGPQRFAVVVDISHSEEVELYAQLQTRVEARVRQRGRQRGR